MKRRYGVFQGLVLSLFSPAYYRDVARNWGGIGLLYLLLLLLLTWTGVLYKTHVDFDHFVQNKLPDVLKDMPDIFIKKGKVSSAVEQPFTVADPKTGQVVFVLDTTGKINSLNDTPAQFLLTETQLHMRDQQQNQQPIDMGKLNEVFGDIAITKEKAQELVTSVGNWTGMISFPFLIVGSLIRALIVILIAGLIGLGFRSTVHSDLSYGSLMRLAAMGMTLPIYLDTAAMLAGILTPVFFWFLITVAITSLYVIFGANAAGSVRPPLEHEDIDDQSPPYRERELDNPEAFRA